MNRGMNSAKTRQRLANGSSGEEITTGAAPSAYADGRQRWPPGGQRGSEARSARLADEHPAPASTWVTASRGAGPHAPAPNTAAAVHSPRPSRPTPANARRAGQAADGRERQKTRERAGPRARSSAAAAAQRGEGEENEPSDAEARRAPTRRSARSAGSRRARGRDVDAENGGDALDGCSPRAAAAGARSGRPDASAPARGGARRRGRARRGRGPARGSAPSIPSVRPGSASTWAGPPE